MPTVQHNTLTSAELHEPKGVAAASANETYVADGAASGSWTEPEPKGVSAAVAGDVYIADGAASGAWTQAFQYANIYTLESDAATLGSIGTTLQTLPFVNNGESNGNVADATNNRITLTNAGVYIVFLHAAFHTTAAGDAGLYEFKINLDAVATGFAGVREMSGSNDTGTMAISAVVNATAGQQLTVSIESDEAGDTDDIDIHMMNLSAFKIG